MMRLSSYGVLLHSRFIDSNGTEIDRKNQFRRGITCETKKGILVCGSRSDGYKPWGRSPSRWPPCWMGKLARGFSPMSPACWPTEKERERAEFRVTRFGRSSSERKDWKERKKKEKHTHS